MAGKRFPGRGAVILTRLFLTGLGLTRQQDDEVMSVDAPKKAARLFVEQVAIDLVAADEPDPMLPVRAFYAQLSAFLLELGDLLRIFKTGFEPALAI